MPLRLEDDHPNEGCFFTILERSCLQLIETDERFWTSCDRVDCWLAHRCNDVFHFGWTDAWSCQFNGPRKVRDEGHSPKLIIATTYQILQKLSTTNNRDHYTHRHSRCYLRQCNQSYSFRRIEIDIQSSSGFHRSSNRAGNVSYWK